MNRKDLVEFIFAPLTEFFWEDDGKLIGHYAPGNSYNCSRQPVHDKLRAKCAEWQEKGKIAVFPLTFGQQFIIVKPEEPPT